MIFESVRSDGLLEEGRPVIVLFSGGRDSTCLLDLAVRVCGGAARALHVNYGLRPSADGDEFHCVEMCERLGVRLEVRRPQRAERGNLQAWAREVRYTAARELARGGDIAAGHTATDQVETILYRLASSPSRRALLGMRPREADLVRPLLGFTRADTATYCRERGLSWREDETNDSETYARARVRHGLVPALEAVHPAAVRNVLAVASQLRDEADVLDLIVDDVLEGRQEVELDRLRALAPAVRRLVVQRLADGAAGQPAPGTGRRSDELAAMGDDAKLDLPHGVRAVSARGVLRFVRRAPDAARRVTGSPT